MKKKICLISYCHSPNYGAALQLYATYKAIERLGYSPIILNYDNSHEQSQTSLKYLFLTQKDIKGFLRFLISGYIFGSKRNGVKSFEAFYNSLTYTAKETYLSCNIVSVPDNVPAIRANNFTFRSRAGNAEDITYEYVWKPESDNTIPVKSNF